MSTTTGNMTNPPNSPLPPSGSGSGSRNNLFRTRTNSLRVDDDF